MRDFDHVEIGTRLAHTDDLSTVYSVSDFGDTKVSGVPITHLWLVELNSEGFNAGKRRKKILNTDRHLYVEHTK